MDVVHAFAPMQLIIHSRNDEDFIPFTWAISRIYNATCKLMALSISYYTLRKNIKLAKKKVIRVIILIFTIFAVSMIAINIILISQIIPTTVFANKVFRRPYDVIPLVLYILCIISIYI